MNFTFHYIYEITDIFGFKYTMLGFVSYFSHFLCNFSLLFWNNQVFLLFLFLLLGTYTLF